MNIYLQLFNDLAFALGHTLVAGISYEKITGNKVQYWQLYIVACLASFISVLAPKFITLIVAVAITLYFCIKNKDISASISAGIASVLAQYGSMIIPEIFVILFIKNWDIYINSFGFNFTISIVFSTMMFFTYLIIKNTEKDLSMFSNIKLSRIVILISLNIFVLIFAICAVIHISQLNIDYTQRLLIIYFFFVVVLISTVILSFLLYKELLKSKIKETEYDLEINLNKKFKEDIQYLHNDIMNFKHDYLKIFSTFKTYLDNENYLELNEYFNKNIVPLNDKFKLADSNSVALTYLEDIPLQSIMFTFLLNAQSCNVESEIYITEHIPKLKINVLEFSRVLGIFLDNALEECTKIQNSKGTVIITINNDIIKISIKNPITSDVTNISDLFVQGKTTKGEGHGRGLFIANDILHTFDNVTFNLDIIDNNFVVNISINNK